MGAILMGTVVSSRSLAGPESILSSFPWKLKWSPCLVSLMKVAAFWGTDVISAPLVSIVSDIDASLGSTSSTGAWSYFGVEDGGTSALSSSSCWEVWDLEGCSVSGPGVNGALKGSGQVGTRVGQGCATGAPWVGVLSRSSRLDLGPGRKTSMDGLLSSMEFSDIPRLDMHMGLGKVGEVGIAVPTGVLYASRLS